ncbi:MAG: right-handed parallel beta-helix repeat-containing protein [Saprospiraceae bacterium]|nr:right-handed parallel beta-helix repeat-containing protein [Bacteroidia bacterium]NNE13722.1 right-handed parallel beta-helix repeat-containing protein [Saprospiraceae bacterium]NNL91818.1 right-handed parallel beta-helix repeat-containing protein [Saprospiraceae bacterium]
MIVKGKAYHNNSKKWIIALALIFALVVYLKFGLNNTPKKSGNIFTGEVIFCGAENVEGDAFKNGKNLIFGAHTQSKEKALNGKYSSKLDAKNRFGMTYIMKNPVKGRRYNVSVWSINPHPVTAHLVVSGDDPEVFYKSTSKTVERNGDFWDKRELNFQVPSNLPVNEIKIYTYMEEGPNEIYFDDFLIKEMPDDTIQLKYQKFVPHTFHLQLNKEAQDYLKKMTKKSIAQGTIYNDGTKTKAKIIDNGVEKKLSMRLKGDWLDHISNYSSYRIDMNSEESWLGMQSFSIQEPRTRGFLREWVFFKFLDYADVLHPRYDFCYYQENNNKPVVFSYEEHFTKNLVENGQRREGPILKLTEDRIWDVTRRTAKHFGGSLPKIEEKDKAYWMSEVRAFKEGKLAKNPTLKNNFDVAQNLMNQYKYNLKPVDQIFDLKRLAKYMALVDVCLAHHAVTWHNQRFYYNPVTSLLEPIGFDAYTPEDPNAYANDIHSEFFYKNRIDPYEPLEQLFYDDKFAKEYFYYLNEYSQPEFIDRILDEINEGIIEREHFLNQRMPKYKYDREEILNKAKKIRIALPAFKKSLLAFREKIEGETATLKLFNSHGFPLNVFLNERSKESVIVYPQNKSTSISYTEFQVPKAAKRIKFQVLGIDSIHTVDIVNWASPKGLTPRQKLSLSDLNEYTTILDHDENNVVFKKGTHVINKPLVIGENKRVRMFSDTEISFNSDGCIFSYSPIKFIGDVDNPITINSEDGKNGSIVVMQAEEKSELKHVVFENQNTFIKEDWNLTGAVNFYESDVDITNVSFRNNNCEDALNIIRSDFELNKCIFYGTFGDAFDADFCKGKIKDCRYIKSGNDAIDVSGSVIEVVNTTIDKAGDKGISAGEQSTVTVRFSNINGAVIGAASKDNSLLKIYNSTIDNCETGLAAFQKKPEFGPAKIVIEDTKLKNVKRNYLIEEKSSLIIND